MDLALNNPQRLICHKTQKTKPNHQLISFFLICPLSITLCPSFSWVALKLSPLSFILFFSHYLSLVLFSCGRFARSLSQGCSSLSQIIWPRWESRQFLTFPIVQTLLPVTFAYSLSSRKNLEAIVMRQLRRWKKLWRRSLTRSHKRTSMGPSTSCWNGTTSALQPKEITSKGTRVSCVYYQ